MKRNKEITCGPIRKSARLSERVTKLLTVSLVSSDEELGHDEMFMPAPMSLKSSNQECVVKKEQDATTTPTNIDWGTESMEDNVELSGETCHSEVMMERSQPPDGSEVNEEQDKDRLCTKPPQIIPEAMKSKQTPTSSVMIKFEKDESLFGPPDFSLQSAKPYIRKSPPKEWRRTHNDSDSSDIDASVDIRNSARNIETHSSTSFEQIHQLDRKPPSIFMGLSRKCNPADALAQNYMDPVGTQEGSEGTPERRTDRDIIEPFAESAPSSSSNDTTTGFNTNLINSQKKNEHNTGIDHIDQSVNKPFIPVVFKEDGKCTHTKFESRNLSVEEEPQKSDHLINHIQKRNQNKKKMITILRHAKKGRIDSVESGTIISKPHLSRQFNMNVRKCGACRAPGHRNLLTSYLRNELQHKLSKSGLIMKSKRK